MRPLCRATSRLCVDRTDTDERVVRRSEEPSLRVLAKLDADEKGKKPILTPGGTQQMRVVSRPGLFKLIQWSNKPQAKKRVPGCTLAAPHNLEIFGKHSISPVRRVISIARPIPRHRVLRGVQHGSTLIGLRLEREVKRPP